MARIRTIKPEFPQSESMGRISRDARLAFILMWPHCDDAGRLRASSRALASLLFPFDDDAPKLVPAWLDELEAEGCITRYEVGANHYLQVENFLKHQKIDHPSKSNIPPPLESSRGLSEDSRIVALDQGKDRTKEGIKGQDQGGGCFDVFFETMPKKISRKSAEASYSKALTRTTADILLVAAKAYAATCSGFEEKYILSPAKWLDDERWTDGANGHVKHTAFTSPEEIEGQRRLKEKAYGTEN